MHAPKPIAWLPVVVLIPQVTGCKSFQPLEGPFPEHRPRYDADDASRVFTKDGECIELYGIWMDSVTVQGKTRVELEDHLVEFRPVQIPLSEVQRIEQRQFDFVRSALTAGGVYVVVAALVTAMVYGFFYLVLAGG
jgi:hypothetical protein